MKVLVSLLLSRLTDVMGPLAMVVVVTALLVLSCAVEDGSGAGTTPASPTTTASSDNGSSTPENGSSTTENGSSTTENGSSTTENGSSTSENGSSASPTSRPITGTVTLRGDGLGVVDFGQNADEVISILEAVLGSSPNATGSQADWVEFIGWADLELFVGFDTPTALDYSGASRFVGWEYYGSDDGTTFMTIDGAGIGSTFPELQALYGDRLEVSTAPDECESGTVYPIVLAGNIYGMLDRAPADDAQVSVLRAGMGVGC